MNATDMRYLVDLAKQFSLTDLPIPEIQRRLEGVVEGMATFRVGDLVKTHDGLCGVVSKRQGCFYWVGLPGSKTTQMLYADEIRKVNL